MEKNITRLLKIAGGQYLRDSTRVLHELYFKGKHDHLKMDNRLISEMLSIDKVKASKVLSALASVNLIEKGAEENTYFAHDKNDFLQICLEKLSRSWQKDLQTINSLFSKNFTTPFVEGIDTLSTYYHLRDIFKNTKLHENIYFEIISGGPASSIPLNRFSEIENKMITRFFSKNAYDIFYERYLELKKRLQLQKEYGISEGTVYYVICIKSLKSYFDFLFKDNRERYAGAYSMILTSLNHSFEELEEYFLSGQLLIYIDLEHKFINGPQIIHGNHIIQCFTENPFAPANWRILHFVDPVMVSYFRQSYERVFRNLVLREGYKEEDRAANFVRRESFGRWLHETQLKKIKDEIKALEENNLP
ncbi:MAG: hypothetical protein ACXQS8_05665 [Candidatus Helarchaeales archaeon]